MATTPQAPAWLLACGLPASWQGQPGWRVLETDFGAGSRLLDLWQQWALDPAGPRMLHVVALTQRAPDGATLQTAMRSRPALAPWTDELVQQWFGFLPGLHRLELHGGRLQLTLCVGPVQPMLRELQFSADSVLLGQPPDAASVCELEHAACWDSFSVKALARLCRRGTRLILLGNAPSLPSAEILAQAGFTTPAAVPDGAVSCPPLRASEFQPHWKLKHTRQRWHRPPVPVSHCVVLGAGLAGAAAAHALARRGWQVTVLDAATAAACGASALPVGLLAPHVSRDDSPRSQLSRAGVRLSLQTARRLLVAGVDYCESGVAELAIDRARALPDDWDAYGRQWSDDRLMPDVATALRLADARLDKTLWHAHGGWIKPARLVQALLAHSGIRFQGNSRVQHVGFGNGEWQLRSDSGEVLAQAPQLVIANAGDAPRLVECAAMVNPGIRRLASLTALHGQVSWARHAPSADEGFPPFPVNGAGSVIAHVPQANGQAWYAGATYESPPPWFGQAPGGGGRKLGNGPAFPQSPATCAFSPAQAHAHNQRQLARLLPAVGARLAPAFDSDVVQAWTGTRWSSADRLPLVGALCDGAQIGVWLSTAMGSRGLTLAILCAEVLAAQLCAEPAPLPARLLRLIAANRASQ